MEERFGNCPECSAPWHLHWTYKREGDQIFRRYNTCALMPSEIMAKWDRRTP